MSYAYMKEREAIPSEFQLEILMEANSLLLPFGTKRAEEREKHLAYLVIQAAHFLSICIQNSNIAEVKPAIINNRICLFFFLLFHHYEDNCKSGTASPCIRFTNRSNSLRLWLSMRTGLSLRYVKADRCLPSGSLRGLAFSSILLYPSLS